jgi:hypothetical protein
MSSPVVVGFPMTQIAGDSFMAVFAGDGKSRTLDDSF